MGWQWTNHFTNWSRPRLTMVTLWQAILMCLILVRNQEVNYIFYSKLPFLFCFVKGATTSACENAAELFKCTVQKSPEVVAKIVADTKSDSGVRRIFTTVFAQIYNYNFSPTQVDSSCFKLGCWLLCIFTKLYHWCQYTHEVVHFVLWSVFF